MTPCPSDSKPDMDFSHTPNAATSTLGALLRCLETWELSVSLDEKITLMEDFTSMLSSCSNGSLSHEMSVYSMWTDTIQISFAVTAHRKRVQLMQQKKETLWLEDSTSANSEHRFLTLGLCGLKSSYRELERNFLRLARVWLQGHFVVPSLHSSATPTGSIDPSPCRTNILVEYRLIQQLTQSSMLGYHTIWRDLNIPVSAPFGQE